MSLGVGVGGGGYVFGSSILSGYYCGCGWGCGCYTFMEYVILVICLIYRLRIRF